MEAIENAAWYNNTFDKYMPSREKVEKKAYTAAKDVYNINNADSFATINVAGDIGKGRRYAGDPWEATIDLGKDKELNDGVETHAKPSRDSDQQVDSTNDDAAR